MIRERLTGGYAGRLEANMNDIPVKLGGDVRLAEGIAGKKDAVAIEGQADISAAKLNFDGLSSKDAKGIIVKEKARADIPDPKVVGKLFQASLPDLPPVTIAANIAGFRSTDQCG